MPTLSVMQIWAMVARRWWVIAVAVIVGGAVGLAVFMWSSPVYRAEVVTVYVGGSDGVSGIGGLTGQLGGLAALAGVSLPKQEERAAALATLRSRDLALRLIREQALLPILFEDRWDATHKRWRQGREPTLGDAIEKFEKKVRTVRDDARVGLITVQIEWSDREYAAKWANDLVDLANEMLRQRVLKETAGAVDLLQSKVENITSLEVRSAIYDVVKSQIQSQTLAAVREDYAFKVIDPALVPDQDKWIWPRRGLLMLLGIVFGFAVGVFCVGLMGRRYLRATPGSD